MSDHDLWRWGLGVSLGVAWNLLSVWALVQLLKAWLVPSSALRASERPLRSSQSEAGPQPSRLRVIAWLAVKIPLLYALAWFLVSRPSVSPLAFGLGFTASLAVLLVRHALRVRPAHDR